MGRNLQLRIKEPCHENWEKMEVGEGGRFCGACSKVVVDFSVMSDREILQYLSRTRGRCFTRRGLFFEGCKGWGREGDHEENSGNLGWAVQEGKGWTVGDIC
jgi:hypothetical protein